jgi:hypothetical protein|tara:strand:- start:593 stop:1969 length:1377 start_codon:yes stop_codon:yes gene_type:complete
MRLLKIFLINIVVILVFFECSSLLYYGIKFNSFFYFDDVYGHRPRDAVHPDFQIGNLVFHPYFGYLSQPRGNTTNHGFPISKYPETNILNCCNSPTKENPKEFIVGVFGGSVATGFGMEGYARKTFISALQDVPNLKGRDIRVLQLAYGAYKQPQTLMILAYYLSLGQRFDLILNVDGFNEVFHGGENESLGFSYSYPSVDVYKKMIDFIASEKSDYQNILSIYFRKLAHREIEETYKTKFASTFVIFDFLHLLYDRLSKVFGSLDSKKGPFFILPSEIKHEKTSVVWTAIAENWRRGHILMQYLSLSNGAKYIGLLQPNKWFGSKLPYPPTQDPMFQSEKWSYRINSGYRELINEVETLKEKGINIIDASDAFNGLKEVYLDDCCHYTKKGYEVLVPLIIKNLTQHRNVDGANGKRVIETDPDVASHVTKMFELYAQGGLALRDVSKKGAEGRFQLP